eukprot:11216262-Lingulodinium_polyedra.AAC.1
MSFASLLSGGQAVVYVRVFASFCLAGRRRLGGRRDVQSGLVGNLQSFPSYLCSEVVVVDLR